MKSVSRRCTESRPTRFLFLVLLLVVLAAPSPGQKLTVYVEPGLDEEEHAADKNKELVDSTNDLNSQINKRGDIVLTEERQTADIVITVLDRRIDVSQDRQTHWGGGHVQNQYTSRYVIVYRLEAADKRHQAEQMAYGSLVTWRSVASNLSKHVERWARENRDELLAWRHRKANPN